MKVLLFTANWCSACQAIKPHVPADIIQIDCDDRPTDATKYNIHVLPTFVAINDDGNELARLQTTSMPVLKNWIKGVSDGRKE